MEFDTPTLDIALTMIKKKKQCRCNYDQIHNTNSQCHGNPLNLDFDVTNKIIEYTERQGKAIVEQNTNVKHCKDCPPPPLWCRIRFSTDGEHRKAVFTHCLTSTQEKEAGLCCGVEGPLTKASGKVFIMGNARKKMYFVAMGLRYDLVTLSQLPLQDTKWAPFSFRLSLTLE